MNEPHLTYPLAKPADGYVKLIHGSVDIKVIDAVFDPTHSITAHPEPLEHAGGRGIGSIRSAGMYDTLPVIRSVWALIPLGNTLVTAITFPAHRT